MSGKVDRAANSVARLRSKIAYVESLEVTFEQGPTKVAALRRLEAQLKRAEETLAVQKLIEGPQVDPRQLELASVKVKGK